MPLIYVTGISGSGKSTILEELKNLGYEAHGIDEEGLADWVDRETGAIALFPHNDPDISIHDWYQKHRWVSSQEHTSRLKAKSDKAARHIILVGYAEEENTIWDLFDKVIYLAVDETTLRNRIENREDNQFGKTAEEMAVILSWLEKNDAHYRSSSAYTVDAARPLNDVVEQVIRVAFGHEQR